MWLLKIINEIPTSVWSGLLGAFIALSGVLITNFGNSNRLKIQLAHDSLEKDKERKSKLRHELYLKAAEELVRANAALASLAYLDLTEKIDAPLSDLSIIISKIMLVTEDEISIDASKLSLVYASVYLKVLEKINPLQELKSDIKSYNDLYLKAQEEVQRILNKITLDNEDKNFDEIRRDILNQSFEFHSKQAENLANKRDEYWDSYNLQLLGFLRYLIPQLQEISSKQIRLMVSIRKEMGIKSSVDNYVRVLQIQNEEINHQLQSYLEFLEKKQLEN